MHAFPLPNNHASLAYYSSYGDITTLDSTSSIPHAVIGVHGADRNADDYFCSLLPYTNETLIISPWFAACSDRGLSNSTLCWDTTHDPNGPWRYGADAVGPSSMSSFKAMNHLVDFLLHSVGIHRVTVVGHSSGGQFVQRWSLLSEAWDTNRIRAVVANPSSYAYLIPERLYDGVWQIPRLGCPRYNDWEWGLNVRDAMAVPYVAKILDSMTVSELIGRFRERTVVYLVGDRDRCTGQSNWCNSHGLETKCQDHLQGYHRLERYLRYLEHLRNLAFRVEGYIIPNIGHDHSLMFNSEQGRRVIFGDESTHARQSHPTSSS